MKETTMTKEEAIKEWQYGSKPQKTKRFFFHYYKAESQKQGRNVLTMHWENTCHIIHHVKAHGVDIETHTQKRQPRCVIRGFASEILFSTANPKSGEITAHIY